MSRSTATTGRERLEALLDLDADFDGALDRPVFGVLAFAGIGEMIIAKVSGARRIDEPAALDRNTTIAWSGNQMDTVDRSQRSHHDDAAPLAARHEHVALDRLIVEQPDVRHPAVRGKGRTAGQRQTNA